MKIKAWVRYKRMARDASKRMTGMYGTLATTLPEPKEEVSEVLLIMAGDETFISLDAIERNIDRCMEPVVKRIMARMERHFLITLGRPIVQPPARKNTKRVRAGLHETKGVVLTDGKGTPKL